jgi:hypothetical protein
VQQVGNKCGMCKCLCLFMKVLFMSEVVKIIVLHHVCRVVSIVTGYTLIQQSGM